MPLSLEALRMATLLQEQVLLLHAAFRMATLLRGQPPLVMLQMATLPLPGWQRQSHWPRE